MMYVCMMYIVQDMQTNSKKFDFLLNGIIFTFNIFTPEISLMWSVNIKNQIKTTFYNLF